MFVKPGCILVSYVDDAILVGPDKAVVEAVLTGLRDLKLDFDRMGDLSAYLGVKIDRLGDGSIKLSQPHLIDSVIAAMGLSDASSKPTPASRTLGKCLDSPKYSGDFNYRSVVGMLLYLSNNSRPDIAFAVHQGARFSSNPRDPHGEALKRIGRYLVGTRDAGLIFKPNPDLRLDCYADADFAGVWSEDNPEDPSSVRSRTGFVITLGGCPVTWSSKMQTEIALSTMESEYIACNSAVRGLIPLKNKLAEICSSFSLPVPDPSKVSIVWEDNQAALQLATQDPPRMTPRSKHIGIKYHWFRSKLKKGYLELHPIESARNLANIFTKPLTAETFVPERKALMGW